MKKWQEWGLNGIEKKLDYCMILKLKNKNIISYTDNTIGLEVN